MFIFKLRRSIGAALAAMAMGVCLVACAQAPSTAQPEAATKISEIVAQASAAASTNCPEKRSEICPTIHKPVCAQRDTGIRCVRAPCPSEAPVTYSNACVACRDPKVLSYVEGACGAATNLTQ